MLKTLLSIIATSKYNWDDYKSSTVQIISWDIISKRCLLMQSGIIYLSYKLNDPIGNKIWIELTLATKL